jgi:hypothetical protein
VQPRSCLWHFGTPRRRLARSLRTWTQARSDLGTSTCGNNDWLNQRDAASGTAIAQ